MRLRGATEIDRRALVEAILSGNPHLHVTMVDEGIAAARGAGVDSHHGKAVCVADIGGGTTGLALVVGGGIVGSRSIRVAGNAMDAAILHAVRTRCRITIGERTAEHLKMAVGLTGDGDGVTVSGVDVSNWGRLRTTEIPPDVVAQALERPVGAIVSALTHLLAEIPPDLADEMLDQGIHLAGGGALLKGLSERISADTSCRCQVVPDPLRCAVRGLAGVLDQPAEPGYAA